MKARFKSREAWVIHDICGLEKNITGIWQARLVIHDICGYPLENLVKEVLNSSETPMHYKEICSKVVAIRNESPALKVSLNSVKNYLIRHNDIAPLQKGFYCVRKHLDMPEEEQKRLAKTQEILSLAMAIKYMPWRYVRN